jgi:hypothetical protein
MFLIVFCISMELNVLNGNRDTYDVAADVFLMRHLMMIDLQLTEQLILELTDISNNIGDNLKT